jgi:predicted enzyme related to lactoylglutathione lyase
MQEPPNMLVNVDVQDLERGIAFYEEALGFALHRKLFDGTVAELKGAASPLYLLQKPSGSSAGTATLQLRDYRRHWTPVHLDFVVARIDAAVERALQAGATIEGEVRGFAWGRMTVMSDPSSWWRRASPIAAG